MPDMKLPSYFYGDEAMQFTYFRIVSGARHPPAAIDVPAAPDFLCPPFL